VEGFFLQNAYFFKFMFCGGVTECICQTGHCNPLPRPCYQSPCPACLVHSGRMARRSRGRSLKIGEVRNARSFASTFSRVMQSTQILNEIQFHGFCWRVMKKILFEEKRNWSAVLQCSGVWVLPFTVCQLHTHTRCKKDRPCGVGNQTDCGDKWRVQ
jgi:hypothetical protein